MPIPLCEAPNLPPPGFVDLSTRPAYVLRVGYAGAENVTGAPLPGYGWPGAWLQEEAASALDRAAARLAAQGLSLVVFDAYRPARASAAMVDWARRTGNMALLGVYIAARSGHNDGGSADLGLADPSTGALLDLGVPWDTFDARAHTANAEGEALTLRRRLAAALIAEGWKPYTKEWWHFRYTGARSGPRDVPYGACEPPEEVR